MSAVLSSFSVSLDAKRRPTLPSALLAEVGIEPGEELVATAEGEGVIRLRTRAAAAAEAKKAIRAGFAGELGEEDAVDELRAFRDDDVRADERRLDVVFPADEQRVAMLRERMVEELHL